MNNTKKSSSVEFRAVEVVDNDDEGEANEEDVEKTEDMGYQQTLMYGRYSRTLADEVRQEAKTC